MDRDRRRPVLFRRQRRRPRVLKRIASPRMEGLGETTPKRLPPLRSALAIARRYGANPDHRGPFVNGPYRGNAGDRKARPYTHDWKRNGTVGAIHESPVSRTRRGDPCGRPARQGIYLSIKRGEFAHFCESASLFLFDINKRRREGTRPSPASASGVQVVLFHYAARPSKERKR